MSGHSKWANIKNKKGKSDAKRASIFTKIGREIAVAVKQGGPDPNSNSRLRDVIAKAKANNMPNDNIERGIKKASGELGAVNYEENVYEGYAAGGVAVIVETLTDNKNRTAGDVRHIFDKCGGSMGTTGCVSYMFDTKGVIEVEKKAGMDDELSYGSVVAEMAMNLLAGTLNHSYKFEYDDLYIIQLITKMNEDKNFIVMAASSANRIYNYLMDIGRKYLAEHPAA